MNNGNKFYKTASNTKSNNYSVRNGNLGGWPSIGENLEKMVHLMELPIKPEMLFIVQKATVCVLDRAVFLRGAPHLVYYRK